MRKNRRITYVGRIVVVLIVVRIPALDVVVVVPSGRQTNFKIIPQKNISVNHILVPKYPSVRQSATF